MNVAVVNGEKSVVTNNAKEGLANKLWDLLVLGEISEDKNVKKQFFAIESAIISNKKHDG
ncbi:hypothetical protein [Bacillus luti]|uniref:hypothetical protein n=1 Tax=Bacillus luti TaxID=2026191 RepID=UPI00289A9514|nr:hypothetical protein [Bacillus luti]